MKSQDNKGKEKVEEMNSNSPAIRDSKSGERKGKGKDVGEGEREGKGEGEELKEKEVKGKEWEEVEKTQSKEQDAHWINFQSKIAVAPDQV